MRRKQSARLNGIALKKEEYDVIASICLDKNRFAASDCVTNGLCCQVLPGICDFKICVKWRWKADCVAAECTDTGSLSRIFNN